MARDFVRPEISPAFQRELLGKRQLLINPDWPRIRKALTAVQKSCRNNKLSEHEVQDPGPICVEATPAMAS